MIWVCSVFKFMTVSIYLKIESYTSVECVLELLQVKGSPPLKWNKCASTLFYFFITLFSHFVPSTASSHQVWRLDAHNQFKVFAFVVSFSLFFALSLFVCLSVYLILWIVPNRRLFELPFRDRSVSHVSFDFYFIYSHFLTGYFYSNRKSECVVVEHTNWVCTDIYILCILCLAQRMLCHTQIFCKHCFVYVWAKFQTRLRISQPYDMFEARLHTPTWLQINLMCVCVYFICTVSMSTTAHWMRTSRYNREKFAFFPLFTYAHTKIKKIEVKIHMSCLLFLHFSSFFDTPHRLNAYLSLRWYFAYFFGLFSAYFAFPQYQIVYMEKLVRIWNNFCVIEHIFLFIPILPWICHINSPHMPDTWLHLLMSDRGVMCSYTRQSIWM